MLRWKSFWRANKKLVALVSSATVLAAGSYVANSQSVELELGTYDPYGTFSEVKKLKIEHLFVPWGNFDPASFDAADDYALKRKRRLLVTVEPWSWMGDKALTADTLYRDMKSGRYDGVISNLCAKLSSLKSDVTVRWGHEMDLANKRYPWSRLTAAQYIELYKHFTDLCRRSGLGLTYMWSPRGEVELAMYYPGSDYVDVIGVSIFALQKWDHDKFGRNRTFREHFEPVYQRVHHYDKPIFIPEYGCHGDEEYLHECFRHLRKARHHFPKLTGVVYFNEKETHPWPDNYGMPDWRAPENFFYDDMLAVASD